MGLLVKVTRRSSYTQLGVAANDGAFGLESTPMSIAKQTRITPRDVARILFRHWRMSVLIFCGVIGLMLLVIAVYPRSYASESKLMIRIGRESVGLDPTATTGDTIMLQKSQEDEVNSAINLLTSREVLERVAERVGPERIVENLPSGETSPAASDAPGGETRSWLGDLLVSLRLSDPGTEMDQAVRRLEKETVVSAPKRSMVITITYKAASPVLAHDVVQTMTDVFLEEHSRLSQTDGSLEFFSQQVDKLYNDLTAAQTELRDRKNAYQLTSSGNRLSILEKNKDAMRQKIYDLRMQETDLMSRYTDAYPPLKEVRRQRELAERLLMDQPNPEAEAGASAKRAPGRSLQARVSPASYEVAEHSTTPKDPLNAELQTLNEQDMELAQLEREVQLLENKYAMHVEKLEQARVNDALGRERITNVKVAQPATLVYKPVAPKKTLLMAGAFFLALIGGVGSAFAAEGLDQTLRTTDQVEAQLGLPVLASLPYREGNRKQHKAATLPRARAAANGDTSQNGSHRYSGYRGLVTALRSFDENGRHEARTIGVVGVGVSKLRSRVAGNVAIEAAASGTESVLLIDADARRRRIAKRFHLNGASGWREILAGTASAKSCVQRAKPGNLNVMGPGGTKEDEPESGSSVNTLEQLDGIKSDYGMVVVDLPTPNNLDDSPAFDTWVDEAVLVVEAEHTRVQAAQRVMDMLNLSGVHVTGVVLANRREYIPRWLYQRL
jgi:polysaccharide biosynthesis transport protein